MKPGAGRQMSTCPLLTNSDEGCTSKGAVGHFQSLFLGLTITWRITSYERDYKI